jgi:hypothetical protein
MASTIRIQFIVEDSTDSDVRIAVRAEPSASLAVQTACGYPVCSSHADSAFQIAAPWTHLAACGGPGPPAGSVRAEGRPMAALGPACPDLASGTEALGRRCGVLVADCAFADGFGALAVVPVGRWGSESFSSLSAADKEVCQIPLG